MGEYLQALVLVSPRAPKGSPLEFHVRQITMFTERVHGWFLYKLRFIQLTVWKPLMGFPIQFGTESSSNLYYSSSYNKIRVSHLSQFVK